MRHLVGNQLHREIDRIAQLRLNDAKWEYRGHRLVSRGTWANHLLRAMQARWCLMIQARPVVNSTDKPKSFSNRKNEIVCNHLRTSISQSVSRSPLRCASSPLIVTAEQRKLETVEGLLHGRNRCPCAGSSTPRLHPREIWAVKVVPVQLDSNYNKTTIVVIMLTIWPMAVH